MPPQKEGSFKGNNSISYSGSRAFSLQRGIRTQSQMSDFRRQTQRMENEEMRKNSKLITQERTDSEGRQVTSIHQSRTLQAAYLKKLTSGEIQPIHELSLEHKEHLIQQPQTPAPYTERQLDEYENPGFSRGRVLFACLFSLLTSQTLILNVENILPTYCADFHHSLSHLLIAFIISSFELSALIFSPFIGKYLGSIGRKNAFIIGDLIIIISTLGFGAMGFVTDDNTYFYGSMAFRFVQGIGNAMIQTACYAIITFVYSDNREKYLGYAEAFTGIGLMLGPVIGGPFFSLLGYFGCFACFSGVIFLSMIVSLIITPSALNKNTDEGQEVEIDLQNLRLADGRKIEVSFKMFLTNKRALIAYLSSTIVCFFMSYQSSFLTEVLEHDKHIDEGWNGPILALSSVTYTISCFAVNIFSGRIPRRLLILISFLMLAGSTILQGPSQWLGLPDEIVIVLIGFALNGVAQGFIFIPLLPDAIEAIYIKEKFVEGDNEVVDQLLSDYGSGLYGTFFSIGMILAPIAGGALFDAVGKDFRLTTDIMTAVCIGWSMFFFLFNVGFTIYSQEHNNKFQHSNSD